MKGNKGIEVKTVEGIIPVDYGSIITEARYQFYFAPQRTL